jgi:FAD/FMN-containing dehydrogenase
MSTTIPTAEIEQLRASVKGTILTSTDEGWDAARTPWNLAIERAPALIALPADSTDVVAVVAFARRNRLRVAPQSSGHNAGSLGPLEDAVLISTGQLNDVSIDVDGRTARVGAGAVWGAVSAATDETGLFALAGSAVDVGIAGYTLGGGLGWLSRKHGLAANHVLSIELVTPDGVLREIGPSSSPDLFWAVRGGAANFGVVTAIEFRLFRYPDVTAGMFLWPYERHLEILDAWHRWTGAAPDEVTSALRIMHFPPLDRLPPFLSGRSVVVIDGVIIGDDAAAEPILRDLRALAPEIDTWAPATPQTLSALHMDPTQPTAGLSATMLLDRLDRDGLEAFAAAIPPDGPLRLAELRHLGGALTEAPEGAGASGSLPGEYLLCVLGAGSNSSNPAIEPALQKFLSAMAPYDTGKVFANFAERPVEAPRLFADANYRRLQEIRAHTDPDEVMLAGHPIPLSRP